MEVLGIWHFMVPLTPEKAMSMHWFKDGIVLDGRIRRSHWRSIKKELGSINEKCRIVGMVQAML